MAVSDAPTGVNGVGSPEIVMRGLRDRPRGWLGWLTTTDHKKIGIMYLFLTFIFFIVGGVEALIMRLQLAVPDGTLVTPETYNGLVSMHGTTMIFLFIVPVLAGFGNYMVPLMIGARDMAFPRLNALSFWLLAFGGIAFYASIFFEPPQAGWTSYAPLSDDAYMPSGGIDAWIFLIHLTGLSSMLGAINFVATIQNMRAKGMGWGRMPLFIWTILVYSYLLIIALPAIGAAVTMLLTDRHFGTDFFDPTGGGDPVLWQHLFWFFGHPEVYIMVLPAFGIISEILPVFARKPIFGYKAVAFSTIGIAFVSMLVWAHHMFAVGMSDYLQSWFMIASYCVAVPTGVKIFNWLATLYKGNLSFTAPMLFALAFIALFV
ncbi:MAG TPA: cbb3-type cytochrome c oxidase subunit I, partial [Thermoleophilaceae bacterium]|nr:cbb3-type cytochrome c oxidase subunit I [Thermoleophilaceae bacterium]